jgi:hypothetical protein
MLESFWFVSGRLLALEADRSSTIMDVKNRI